MANLQAGDTATFTLVTGAGVEHTTGFIQRVHTYDNGALSVVYRYASNPRGISWGAYIEPENVSKTIILESNPDADTTPRSLLP